jgi:hypothetical protein
MAGWLAASSLRFSAHTHTTGSRIDLGKHTYSRRRTCVTRERLGLSVRDAIERDEFQFSFFFTDR